MECLKPATELKLVSRGNEFHAFITRSLKKTRPCTGVAASFEQLKTVPSCVFNKNKLEVINWHVNNTKQNFIAPDQIGCQSCEHHSDLISVSLPIVGE